MRTCAKALVLVGMVCCAAARAQDFAAAVASPHALAEYVETHEDIEWQPIWDALGVNEQVFLPRCDTSGRSSECSTELIAIQQPRQMILMLEHRSTGSQVYLRYRSEGLDTWKFAGAYNPVVKYFEPEHHVIRVGAKPFLVVTSQGYSGTGLSVKEEDWIDLTTDRFEPAFGLTKEGEFHPAQGGIARHVWGAATSLSADRIEVGMSITFTVETGDSRIDLGDRRDEIVYLRSGAGKFVIDPRASSATADQVKDFYDEWDPGPGPEAFVKFHLKGLLAVAKGDDDAAKAWLKEFLSGLPDSAESRQIKAALNARR